MQYTEIVSRVVHQTLFPMWKQLQMGLRAFLLIASRVWTCLCYTLKKQTRAVSILYKYFSNLLFYLYFAKRVTKLCLNIYL